MTATYTPFSTDKDRVRFYLGDTVTTAAKFSDEEITAAISEFGAWRVAVLELLNSLIATLSATPNYKADWLQEDIDTATKQLRALHTRLTAQFGINTSRVITRGVAVYRADSLQTDANYTSSE
jgi:hypothetical protein